MPFRDFVRGAEGVWRLCHRRHGRADLCRAEGIGLLRLRMADSVIVVNNIMYWISPNQTASIEVVAFDGTSD